MYQKNRPEEQVPEEQSWSTKEGRIEFLERFKAFLEHCAELFQIWRTGDFSVVWPPHAFIPWIPPLKCAAV